MPQWPADPHRLLVQKALNEVRGFVGVERLAQKNIEPGAAGVFNFGKNG